MATADASAPAASSTFLRNPAFDLFFIVGIPAIAISVGGLITLRPELFLLIFSIDLWLLGYHHVAATFTRLCFDTESFRERRSLVLYLPFAVAAVVITLVVGVGLWLIATIYLYWQWWHYTRQSEGLSKAYAAKNRGKTTGNAWLARATFYAVPIAGILTVSARRPEEFIFMPIRTLPIPSVLAVIAQIVALGLVATWAVEQAKLWRKGQAAKTYIAYTLTHFLIYSTAYVFFENATQGWMVINIWHNTQYIAFVWMFNNRRFSQGPDPAHAFLSTLSQTKNWWMYLAACLTISTAFYYSAESALAWWGTASMAYVAAFYQAMNFHHYIVDSRVWKLRQPAVRRHVGLTQSTV